MNKTINENQKKWQITGQNVSKECFAEREEYEITRYKLNCLTGQPFTD